MSHHETIRWNAAVSRRTARLGSVARASFRRVQPPRPMGHSQGRTGRGRSRPGGNRSPRDVGGNGRPRRRAGQSGVHRLSQEPQARSLLRRSGPNRRGAANGIVGGGPGKVCSHRRGADDYAPGAGSLSRSVARIPGGEPTLSCVWPMIISFRDAHSRNRLGAICPWQFVPGWPITEEATDSGRRTHDESFMTTDYLVDLETFRGPLDLLLYLV